MEMYISKFRLVLLSLCITAVFLSCGDMEALMPSADSYKINLKAGGISLDDCAFIKVNDVIRPQFETAVADDPDITSLVMYLRNSYGEIGGSRVIYTLNSSGAQENKKNDNDDVNNGEEITQDKTYNDSNNNASDGNNINTKNSDKELYASGNIEAANNAIIIPVKNMDTLPPYSFPKGINAGWYTIICQVMSGNDTLYKGEKKLYYLADKNFLFKDIYVSLPGIMTGSQYIPKDTTVMLETKIEFDEVFDPYIIWYNGKKIIGEGKYSDNEGKFFWITPNQSAFLLLRAEVFPVTNNRQETAGFSKQISLPVSSKSADFSLLSKDVPNVKHLYLFDGNLNDSASQSANRKALTSSGKIRWMSANGHYGLAGGPGLFYSLPKITLPADEQKAGEFLFRFKPLSDGEILTAHFDASSETLMKLSYEENKLILTLKSAEKTSVQAKEIFDENSFISAKINFYITHEQLSAKLLLDEEFGAEKKTQPILINARLDGGIQTYICGHDDDNSEKQPAHVYTVLWDEFAFVDISKKNKNAANNQEEEITQNTEENNNDVSMESELQDKNQAL